MVGVNEKNRRVGDSHHNARLTDHEVDLIFELYGQGYGYRKLAAKFEISKRHVRDILSGRRRGQVASAWRVVP